MRSGKLHYVTKVSDLITHLQRVFLTGTTTERMDANTFTRENFFFDSVVCASFPPTLRESSL